MLGSLVLQAALTECAMRHANPRALRTLSYLTVRIFAEEAVPRSCGGGRLEYAASRPNRGIGTVRCAGMQETANPSCVPDRVLGADRLACLAHA